MAIEALDSWTPEEIAKARTTLDSGAWDGGVTPLRYRLALDAIERRDGRITLLREMLDRANAIIGEQADEAKRLSDECESKRVLLDKCREPCPNHPHIIGLPFEACPVCVNST